MSISRISRGYHLAIAKCVRNARIPEEPRTRLIRDLCVLMKDNNPVAFDQNRFIGVCLGHQVEDSSFKMLNSFDTLKYLDEVYEYVNKAKANKA
jgi:hypothetical protein